MMISSVRAQYVPQAMMPVAAPNVQGDDDAPQVELVPQGIIVEAGPDQPAPVSADVNADAHYQEGHRPFSKLMQLGQVVRAEQIAQSGPGTTKAQRVGNAAFATAFDSAPAHTPVGRTGTSGAPAQGCSPQLGRALAEYGAMRALRGA